MTKSEQMSEKEYIEQLKFCTEHGILCFEYHRRHRNEKNRQLIKEIRIGKEK